jgi:hypothetical protein
VKTYTAHLRDGRAPILLREGFSLGAFFFGPLWLLAHRALIAAAFALAAELAAGFLLRDGVRIAVEVGIAVLLGVSGYDLVRWQLGLRGYRLAFVLAARDSDTALIRLLAVRPDLAGDFLPPGRA